MILSLFSWFKIFYREITFSVRNGGEKDEQEPEKKKQRRRRRIWEKEIEKKRERNWGVVFFFLPFSLQI